MSKEATTQRIYPIHWYRRFLAISALFVLLTSPQSSISQESYIASYWEVSYAGMIKVLDIDGDGTNEIISVSKSDPNDIWLEWPNLLQLQEVEASSGDTAIVLTVGPLDYGIAGVLVQDLDGDSTPELIVKHASGEFGWGGFLEIYSISRPENGSWTSVHRLTTPNPADLADLDGDSDFEILLYREYLAPQEHDVPIRYWWTILQFEEFGIDVLQLANRQYIRAISNEIERRTAYYEHCLIGARNNPNPSSGHIPDAGEAMLAVLLTQATTLDSTRVYNWRDHVQPIAEGILQKAFYERTATSVLDVVTELALTGIGEAYHVRLRETIKAPRYCLKCGSVFPESSVNDRAHAAGIGGIGSITEDL